MKEVWFFMYYDKVDVMLQGTEHGYTEYDVECLQQSEEFESFEEAWKARKEKEKYYTVTPVMKGYIKE